MKKADLFKAVTEEVTGILDHAKVAQPVKENVLGVLTKYLEPKKGGARVNIEDVVKRDKDGNITHILDASGVAFLPATIENFYEAKNGGIEVAEGLRLKRLSRLGEKLRKESEKVIRTSEKAIMEDVLNGKITPEEGKAKLEEIKETNKPDYSKLLEVKGAIKA